MTATLITRAQAGLPPLPSNVSTNITPDSDTAHYGGGSPWKGLVRVAADADHNRCASIWRAWRDYHVNGNKWADIAYSYGVCPHGFIFEGRGKGRRTAANGTNVGNQTSYAIVYIAGDGDHVTEEARRGFLDAAALLGQPIRWPHRHWLSTGCPGQFVMDWLNAGQPSTGGTPAPAPPIVVPPPAPPAAGAPAFPLPLGWYFGPKTGPRESVSGYFSHRDDLHRWQQRMKDRGWNIGPNGADGFYGDDTKRVAEGFQRDKGGHVDGLVGRWTWDMAWVAPVT